MAIINSTSNAKPFSFDDSIGAKAKKKFDELRDSAKTKKKSKVEKSSLKQFMRKNSPEGLIA